MSAPLQSKKDIHKIEPFNRKMGPPMKLNDDNNFMASNSMALNIPNIDTKTGDVFRLSASGNEIETVSTDPRLVPSHSVGISAVGSVRWREKNRSN
jgi:hypothetical protein